jgi:hypothetical protein
MVLVRRFWTLEASVVDTTSSCKSIRARCCICNSPPIAISYTVPYMFRMRADKSFGERVAAALRLRNMRAAELARAIGQKPAIVSHWLTGKRRCPEDVVAEIARVLRVSNRWLSEGEGTPPTRQAQIPGTMTVPTSDEGQEHGTQLGWHFRRAPVDGGRDYGNANTYATPPKVATFVREIGQNSTDAAYRFGGVPSPVVMRYSVIELSQGSDAYSKFLERLSYPQLKAHIEYAVNEAAGRSKLALKLREGLSAFESEKRIVLLRVDDYGTVGLHGPELTDSGDDQLRSSPYAALVRNNLDSSKDAATAGGSYGLGKAVLWNCSALSTVLFASRIPNEDRGIRVTGRTELTWHRSAHESFAGPGWFGAPPYGTSNWIHDNSILKDLCLDRESRLPPGVEVQSSWGTSALVVGFQDPEGEGVEDVAELLKKIAEAAAENFFPAILGARLRVILEHSVDGVRRSQVEISPDEYIPEFCGALRAHSADELAENLEEPGNTIRRTIDHRIPGTRLDAPGVDCYDEMNAKSQLLIRYDEDPREGSEARFANSVALVRGRGMVVRYWSREGIGLGAKPFHAILLAGEAVGGESAQRAAEQFLRLAEPPAHDAWEYRQEVKVAYKVGARSRLKELMESITEELRKALRPTEGGEADGPEELKRLLQFGGADPVPAKATLREIKARLINGAWHIDAQIHFNDRSKTLRVSPRVWIDVESGSAIRLPWNTLSFQRGRDILHSDNGAVVIAPPFRTVSISGVTSTSADGIEAALCRAKLDLVTDILPDNEAI